MEIEQSNQLGQEEKFNPNKYVGQFVDIKEEGLTNIWRILSYNGDDKYLLVRDNPNAGYPPLSKVILTMEVKELLEKK